MVRSLLRGALVVLLICSAQADVIEVDAHGAGTPNEVGVEGDAAEETAGAEVVASWADVERLGAAVAQPSTDPLRTAGTRVDADGAGADADAEARVISRHLILIAANTADTQSKSRCASAAAGAGMAAREFLNPEHGPHGEYISVAEAAPGTASVSASASAPFASFDEPLTGGGARQRALLGAAADAGTEEERAGSGDDCVAVAFFEPGSCACRAAQPAVLRLGALPLREAAARSLQWLAGRTEIGVGIFNQHSRGVDIFWHGGGDGTDNGFGGGEWHKQASLPSAFELPRLRAEHGHEGAGFPEVWVNSFIGARFKAVEAGTGRLLGRWVHVRSGAHVLRAQGSCLPARVEVKDLAEREGQSGGGVGVSAAQELLLRRAAHGGFEPSGEQRQPLLDVAGEQDNGSACEVVQSPAYEDLIGGQLTKDTLVSAQQQMEDSRHYLNARQPQQVPKFTAVGFEKRRLPRGLWQRLLMYYRSNRAQQVLEDWPLSNTYTNHYEVPILQVPMSWSLKEDVHESLRPIAEEWSKTKLVRTDCYGIRVYQRGAVLRSHIDRIATHAVSVIVNIDQHHDGDGWPLEISDHAGKVHRLRLTPGDMVLYESAACLHGRETPFKGTYFANCFVHFKPTDRAKWDFGE